MIWVIILVMLSAGVLGGIVNVAVSGEGLDHKKWFLAIIMGVGASLLMPLFLQTVSSNLLVNLLGNEPKNSDILVFGAFCLLASISSKAFIQTLSDRVLREAQEAKKMVEEAEKQYSELRDDSRQTAALATAAHDALRFGVKEIDEVSSAAAKTEFPKIKHGEVPDDPWAGQFGGKPKSGSRVLSAEIYSRDSKPEFCTIRLTVRSTDPEDPLDSPVQFYLHPTFENYTPIVPISNGEASLTVVSWGAFVVGALADGGKTLLELDLSEHPMAREPWRSR